MGALLSKGQCNLHKRKFFKSLIYSQIIEQTRHSLLIRDAQDRIIKISRGEVCGENLIPPANGTSLGS